MAAVPKTEKRMGRQTPTQAVILPYEKTLGNDAVRLYNSSGRKAYQWQELLLYDMLAVNDDGLWLPTKFGYAVPRGNACANGWVTTKQPLK